MPDSFEVAASTGSYRVTIAPGLLQAALAKPRQAVFLVDAMLAGPLVEAGLDPIVLVADETAKSLDRMAEVIVAMRERRATRETVLVAIGGGAVQDAAAFAASIYMRGIAWVYVPTTLLSMADSCIGGKSSINVGTYKNIVGTFHPPIEVVVDTALTASLSAEQKAAGLCEAAKICLCRGRDTFERYLALRPAADANEAALTEIVALSLHAKKWFIEVDEFDRAERLLLNFGHTFGHALEAASGFGISHGIAVGLGMLAALHLGEALGRDYTRAPHVTAFRAHVATLVGTVNGLAEVLARVETPALMDAFAGDKKHTRDSFAVIVVAENGSVERRLLPRDPDTEAMIQRAFAGMLASCPRTAPSLVEAA